MSEIIRLTSLGFEEYDVHILALKIRLSLYMDLHLQDGSSIVCPRLFTLPPVPQKRAASIVETGSPSFVH